MNFAKFLRTPFSQNTSGRLLLHFIQSLCVLSLVKEAQLRAHLRIDSLFETNDLIQQSFLRLDQLLVPH